MGFYTDYSAVFEAVKAALEEVESIESVVLGEPFKLTVSGLPKAIINAASTPMLPAEMGSVLTVKIGFDIVVAILDKEPQDWFTDIISIMGDVVDAVLADRTLDSTVSDCYPTAFAPGEIKFEGALFFGGVIHFQAVMLYSP